VLAQNALLSILSAKRVSMILKSGKKYFSGNLWRNGVPANEPKTDEMHKAKMLCQY
jgi:hypothetical protein